MLLRILLAAKRGGKERPQGVPCMTAPSEPVELCITRVLIARVLSAVSLLKIQKQCSCDTSFPCMVLLYTAVFHFSQMYCAQAGTAVYLGFTLAAACLHDTVALTH